MKYIKYYENIDWKEDWEEEDPDYSENIPINKPIGFYEQYVGRKVTIKKDSVFYGMSKKSNPKDVIGTIIKADLHPDYFIRVKWLKRTNVYRPEDLVLV